MTDIMMESLYSVESIDDTEYSSLSRGSQSKEDMFWKRCDKGVMHSLLHTLT